MTDYQVCMSHCSFLPYLMLTLDITATVYLRKELPVHRESHLPAFQSCGLTHGRESADLGLPNGMYDTANTGYYCGNSEGCLGGSPRHPTRKGVLWGIERRSTGEQEQRVFLLNGLTGTGKSTIAPTVVITLRQSAAWL